MSITHQQEILVPWIAWKVRGANSESLRIVYMADKTIRCKPVFKKIQKKRR